MTFRANLISYTANDTWTKPTDLFGIRVLLRGAGGGGGGGMWGAWPSEGNLHRGGAGGGGGCAVRSTRVWRASELPATLAITVGTGGAGGATITSGSGAWTRGSHGGDSSVGDLITAEGGLGATYDYYGNPVDRFDGGRGGRSNFPGGKGANAETNLPGESVSSGVRDSLAGGGGGGQGGGVLADGTTYRDGTPGGASGFSTGGYPAFWQWCQSGAGGHGGTGEFLFAQNGYFPAGGGGGGHGGGWGGGNGASGHVTIIEYLYTPPPPPPPAEYPGATTYPGTDFYPQG